MAPTRSRACRSHAVWSFFGLAAVSDHKYDPDLGARWRRRCLYCTTSAAKFMHFRDRQAYHSPVPVRAVTFHSPFTEGDERRVDDKVVGEEGVVSVRAVEEVERGDRGNHRAMQLEILYRGSRFRELLSRTEDLKHDGGRNVYP